MDYNGTVASYAPDVLHIVYLFCVSQAHYRLLFEAVLVYLDSFDTYSSFISDKNP